MKNLSIILALVFALNISPANAGGDDNLQILEIHLAAAGLTALAKTLQGLLPETGFGDIADLIQQDYIVSKTRAAQEKRAEQKRQLAALERELAALKRDLWAEAEAHDLMSTDQSSMVFQLLKLLREPT